MLAEQSVGGKGKAKRKEQNQTKPDTFDATHVVEGDGYDDVAVMSSTGEGSSNSSASRAAVVVCKRDDLICVMCG